MAHVFTSWGFRTPSIFPSRAKSIYFVPRGYRNSYLNPLGFGNSPSAPPGPGHSAGPGPLPAGHQRLGGDAREFAGFSERHPQEAPWSFVVDAWTQQAMILYCSLRPMYSMHYTDLHGATGTL